MLKRVILFGGALVVAVAAAWASFSTLASLAEATGWASGPWLLPTSIDVLGALACYVWLTKSFPEASRRFARGTTFAAIGVSVVGNGVGHLLSSGMLAGGVLLIVLVGAIPPSSLAALIHMIVLATSAPVATGRRNSATVVDSIPTQSRTVAPTRKRTTGARKATPTSDRKAKVTPTATPEPTRTASPTAETDPTSEDELLLHRAKKADESHRSQHGRPISRDRLRDELNIGTAKAADLVKELRGQEEVA